MQHLVVRTTPFFRQQEVVRLIQLAVDGLVLVDWTLFQFLRHYLTLLSRLVGVDIVGLHFGEIKLLWAED